ncbi:MULTISPECIES: valine--tRNA ligase [Thermotoga]|uniref:valine--tRNA ligase n=1 Tax=Thermotoga TaxID=2335 RepID=UPI0002E582DB|nr:MULTISPECIES: valine--tRNA ligase [Thermotoga]AJG40845.1 valyl-tRNA synthetase [Thermotoga sp. RQ7]KFZ21970.1 valyl-tRNA ligase [Thermotoga neapolitana LA10]HBF11340.1 valine--tRNA ligase [Thermotoga neapolitana]
MAELSTRYNPAEIETKWYRYWEEKGYFTPKGVGEKFSIVIPPPNITGRIHMGHALNITLQDIVVRYKRMKGYDVLWVPGEDHAGIATQNAVEKFLLQTQGKTREEIGREKFLEITWEWANKYRREIREQIKALGASVDWTRERFTLDEGLSRAVRKVFVELYKKGLIYRGKYIVNWCPRCKTVLSDEEVEHKEHQSKLYYVKYPVKDSDEYIVVATTRPETMLGDTAVAVHPEDERYKDFVGKTLILPLVGREIPVVADKYVDPKFGTGAVKVTPAHDPNDYLIAQRHNLPMVEIFDDNARINENGGKYRGLDRYEAREKIVKDLEEQGFLVKIEDYTHSVGHCYRCDTVIEPKLSDQWFVATKPLAKRGIEAVEKGEIKFFPERWTKIYLNWMYEIRDWCISRQLWWGHRIPVWYCQDCGHINVSEEDVEKCEKCGSTNLKQDEDVLDTWFSSALWPFSTLGWPEETEDLKRYYPTDLLVTGFDIIFFWVARMIMMGYEFMNEKPFSHVYIHQLVRDKYGRKMSKSLGNGIDPLEVIDEYGADPMRFTLAILAAQGRDIKLDPRYFDAYKKFANKIWNATRFVLMNLEDYKEVPLENLKTVDKWILTRLNKTVKEVTSALENYDFNIAARTIYNFFWDEFCDWYIEASKPRLKTEERHLVQTLLVKTLDTSLRLLHPFMPFLTEELWQKLPVDGESITIAKWPEVEEENIDEAAEKEFTRLMNMIRGVRNVRAEMNLPQSQRVRIFVKGLEITDEMKLLLKTLGNIEEIAIVNEKPQKTATAYVEESVEVYVDLGGLIDFEKEKERLKQNMEKIKKEIDRLEKKLSNKDFLEKAPEEVVEETKERLESNRERLERLESILKDLE